ncbi:hypothetical protein BLS_008374 [Venturia inaequalis]|uniref:Cyclin N-terminal domain-containing protein n=1 Tax=Venturia inaequalis TaxID=5025 RepID=A0A8H3YL19_VENIN|nr:hypothetical protein BLS_008374 [Venturia inaequalis]
MDAKPMRPRGLSRQRDENVPVANMAGPAKTLHSRAKSTSTLSSMIQNGVNGIQAKPHRRAFQDLTNSTRPSQDDFGFKYDALSAKQKLAPLKEATDVPSKSLLAPAHRMLTRAPPKATPLALVSAVASAVQPHVEATSDLPRKAAPKPITKKNTQVFRETLAVEAVDAALASLYSRTNAPVHQLLEAPREKASIAAPIQADQIIEPHNFSNDILDSVNQVLAGTISANVYDKQLPPVPSVGAVDKVQSRSSETEMYLPALEQLPPLPVDAQDELQAPLVASEPEEDGEHYYDAEPTAHSFKSTGDNTTGALTQIVSQIIDPVVSHHDSRELIEANEYVKETRTEEDIEDEAWDTSMVAEYGDEIFAYMRTLELKMRPNEHYMDNQAEIQWSMRAVLMDWLIQVHARFQLLPETLFLAVNYVDRFLSCKVVSLGKLQLVGATAIFVAAKYEEINCPSVQEIVYMVDGGYTVDEILKAERFMLSMLQFELGWPGPMSFLRRISKADEYDLETRTLAKYLLEVMIMDERFVACAPSFAAATSHCLARLLLRKGDWGLEHVHYSQYTWSQLHDVVQLLVKCCKDPRSHHSAVYEKYTEKKYKRASLYVETELQNGFQLPPKSRSESSSWSSSLWK